MTTAHIKRDLWRKGSGDKPDDFADMHFIYEIAVQCESAMRCFGEIEQRAASRSTHGSALAFAHMLLVFAGNVVKLLQPPGKAHRRMHRRADRLRAALGVAPAELVAIRRARNYLEHFDERMDEFLDTHKQGLLAGRVVDFQYPTEVQLDDGRKFRPAFMQFLNLSNGELTLYDRTVPLAPIAALMSRLQQSAQMKLDALKTDKNYLAK